MKTWMVVGLLVLGLSLPVGAQEEEPEPVLNDLSSAAETFKKFVDTLEPGVETLYNAWDANDDGGEWAQGFSASLWEFTSNEIGLGSLRIGYAIDFKPYLGLRADLPGLTDRYLAPIFPDWLTPALLESAWSFVGGYANVGPVAGYDFDNDVPILGVSLGIAFTW